jgi:hypothetical protein
MAAARVARFFSVILNQKNGENIYQITNKYTKWLYIIPNVRKIDLVAIKYTNLFN